ncbi:hypothetical protein AALP_AAs52616U000100 [Arabis alpina]|uniref:Uncharacterized protein n=1 Tax=Arabis alpina TaxID=50452 RepID=A0A087G0J5_ARAAL|nr:hypothetical protein AALP_AAs52616U000100 [Arabis alpina]
MHDMRSIMIPHRLWQHYQRYTPEEAISARPDFIPKDQWQVFVHLQFSDKAKNLRVQNKKSRSHYKIPPTLGKKNIARKSKEIVNVQAVEKFFCAQAKKLMGTLSNEEARNSSVKLTENMENTSQIITLQNHTIPAPSETKVIGLRNRVHELEGKVVKVNELEDKMEKLKALVALLAPTATAREDKV